METMKAVQFHEYGAPDVLRVEDAPKPSPNDDEILVRVHAAGVNPVDAKVRSGAMRGRAESLPHVAGLDFAGVIEQVGKATHGFLAGDEVYGRTRQGKQGSYAQFVVVRPGDIAAKPRSLDFAAAAALPTAALTAWQALFASRGTPTMDLKRGQRVLIDGASGGVGTFAVQLAKWRGATVAATARSENETYVKELGADLFIDYTKDTFGKIGRDLDAALDVVGLEMQLRALDVLKPGGVLVSTVGVHVEDEARARSIRTVAIVAATDASVLADVAKLVDEGVLLVPVSEELPIERAQEAHRRIESGHTRGKIVLDVH